MQFAETAYDEILFVFCRIYDTMFLIACQSIYASFPGITLNSLQGQDLPAGKRAFHVSFGSLSDPRFRFAPPRTAGARLRAHLKEKALLASTGRRGGYHPPAADTRQRTDDRWSSLRLCYKHPLCVAA